MKIEFLYLLFTFAFFSVLGWGFEVVYRSFYAKRFVNPGLFKGPYLVLYGMGAIILIKTIVLLDEHNIAIKLAVYLVVTSGFEIISGLIALYLFRVMLWDYSDQRFNYKGLVCIVFSIYWVVSALVFECLIFPAYQIFFVWLPLEIKEIFVVVLISIMMLDFLLVLFRRFFSFTSEEMNLLRKEYIDVAKPILGNPRVQKLVQYKHHRKKTRLEHVNEVAYFSFIIGKRLSLNCNAIIKGALLHDLFYYDWLREGPRFHGFRHHNIALKNARLLTSLSKKEEDIIRKHMWPLTIIPPCHIESLVVSLVDKFCSIRDYLAVRRIKVANVPIGCKDSELGSKER